jgi:DNA-binding NarL/FixJ family response regulator
VLILTMHENDEILTEALLTGVRGFLLKSDAREHLISAIEALLATLLYQRRVGEIANRLPA